MSDLQRNAASILLWSPYELDRQPATTRRKIQKAADAMADAVEALGKRPGPVCAVDGCDSRVRAKRLCGRHYSAAWRLSLDTERYLDWLAFRRVEDYPYRHPREWFYFDDETRRS